MSTVSRTLTFLFTDIEGSTALWESHPEQMALALQRHDRFLRAGIESAGGIVFKTVGDAFCAVFDSPAGAVAAAIALQDRLESERWAVPAIRVRMAIHSGEAEHRDDDYFGPTLNAVARLLSAGHGGQILVSETTRALAEGARSKR